MPNTSSLAAASAMFAIATVLTPASQEPPRFTAEAELVVLHVTVKDRNGSYVSGLTADAFRVFEDNRPQPIGLFAREDAPVTIGLVIDSSGSMRNARDRVIAAAAAFVETSNPRDEVFALVFNDDVRPVLAPSSPFTSDAPTLTNALAHVFVPAGRTSLYDAIADGLAYVARGARDRRVLVVLSDGGDNASHATFDDVLRRTQASNTAVYTIALTAPTNEEANPKHLKQFADTSGGMAFSPDEVNDVASAFRQISADVRQAYTIGYMPSDTPTEPAFRRLRVEVRSADGRRLVTRTRRGYLAGHPDGSGHAR